MPKLWNDTIEAHRREVCDAILETTANLVAKHGLRGVTMSRIAEEAGIGRATLYKYFPDVEAILLAWHEQHIGIHLDHLARFRDQSGAALQRLKAMFEHYALLRNEHDGSELAALLHHGEHVARAHQRLHTLVRELLSDCIEQGDVRDDVAPAELSSFCLHALDAAGALPSKAAVHRLVRVIMSGIQRT